MSKAGLKSELSKSDRQELRRIVKGRFDLLREQMETRAKEIRMAIKERIVSDHQVALKDAEKRGAKMAKKLRDFHKEIKTLNEEMKSRGIIMSGRDLDYYFKNMIDSLEEGWQISNLDSKVNRGVDLIKIDHGHGKINLEQERLQILENLSLDALESDKAKEFLGSIPKVDDFMPLPKGEELKQLSA